MSFGVYNEKDKGFIGIRGGYTQEDRYLFTEYHWDTGEPFGTVDPKEALEKVQDGIGITERKNQALFEWLDQKWDEYDED